MPRHRRHIALTVWPILVLSASELARLWPALRGASAFASASPVSWGSLTAFTVVVVASLAAYALGWSTWASQSATGPGPYRSAGCLRLQKLAGGIAWGLVVAHLSLQWFMTLHVGAVALSHYEMLRGFLSRPPVVGFYVLGLAGLGLFLSQGIAASFRAWGLAQTSGSSRLLEVGCTLISAAMVLMTINVLSHFVTGRAYWMGESGAATRSTDDHNGDAR